MASRLALLVFPAATLAQAPEVQAPRVADVPALSGLTERWNAALQALDAPGFALAIVQDGKVLALDAFGVRNVAGDPATPDTCYYIASAAKPFTAMAACMLAGEGKLDLDAPVKKVLPQLELADEALTRTLALRDLLCHRPGIASGAIAQRESYTGQIDDELYFALLREADIAHEVRYHNVHFTLAGRVIEAVSGQKWPEFLTQRLFVPAGMTRTTAYAREMYGKGEHAEPMLFVDSTWIRCPLVKTDRTMHAAGGIGTTARDAARWLLLNTNRGELDGRRFLTEGMAREFFTQQSAHAPSGSIRIEEGFALGWNTGKYREATRPYFFHGGGYVGAESYFCFLPKERIGVAVLVNTSGDLATIVSIDVLDRLLGVKGQPDLLPTYAESARERRAKNVFPDGENPARSPDGLSAPAEKYAGRYTNADDGELEVLFEEGELKARIGDLPFALFSTGRDRFTAWVVPGMSHNGSFELTPAGDVAVVTLASSGPASRFVRIGARDPGPAPKRNQVVDPDAYVGTYRAPEYTCDVRARNGKLFVQMTTPPQPELELEPTGTQHEFEVPSAGARFVFELAGSTATGFTIHQGGATLEFARAP